MMATSKKSRRWEGTFFMLKAPKNRREKLHKKCEGRYRTEWPLLRGTFSYECNVRLDYVLGLVVGNQSSHKPQSQYTLYKFISDYYLGKTLIKIFANKKVACGQKAGKALFGQSKFSVIPNGIDTAKYYVYDENTRSILRRKLNMKLDAFQICHVGRFVDVKNHKFILEVARELKMIM